MVSMLAFYSDDLSSNPAEAYCFFCQTVFEKNENKQKEAGVDPLLKSHRPVLSFHCLSLDRVFIVTLYSLFVLVNILIKTLRLISPWPREKWSFFNFKNFFLRSQFLRLTHITMLSSVKQVVTCPKNKFAKKEIPILMSGSIS